MTICVLCNNIIHADPLTHWASGNNAAPLADGQCCDNCNNLVVAHRIAAARSRKIAAKILRPRDSEIEDGIIN